MEEAIDTLGRIPAARAFSQFMNAVEGKTLVDMELEFESIYSLWVDAWEKVEAIPDKENPNSIPLRVQKYLEGHKLFFDAYQKESQSPSKP